jgi:multiple sugar transport system substrate-binding protein
MKPDLRSDLLRLSIAASGRPLSRRALVRRGALIGAGSGTAATVGPWFLRGGVAQADLAGYETAGIDWKQAEGQRIVLGALEHPWTAAVEPVLPTFTELTGIEVEVQKASETEYVTRMPVTLAGGSPTPDVYMVWAFGQAVEGGWLQPLDEYYDNADLTDLAWYDEEDVFASARQFPVWQPDGLRYAVAITAEAETLFMRQDLLEAAGLEAPATMDDLMALALALKTDEVAGIAMRGKATADAAPWPAGGFIFSYGGQIIDEEGKAVFDSDEAVAAIEMYGNLLREAGPVGVGNYHWMEALGDFQQGKVAIGCDSSNFAIDIEDPSKSTVAGKTLFGAMPGGNGAPAKPNMWHWLLGMNAASEQKDAAWLFLQWVTSQPAGLAIAANSAALPRASAWEEPAFREKFGEQAADAALANLAAADGEVMTRAWFNPKFPQVGDVLAIAINRVIIGEADARTALTEAAAQANEELAG